MKKLFVSLIACLAFSQSIFAACSPLCETIRQIEAILDSISLQFPNVIPSSESIVDVRRKTKEINTLGEIQYFIVTRLPEDNTDDESSNNCREKHHKKQHCRTYLATILVTPNPGIGPQVVTVENIERVRGHKCPIDTN